MVTTPGVPAELAAALSDRYRVERELGRGGMATVYLAEDLKHRRRVAIKVLHPELAGALGAERFLREIATVAALRHPHIMPLYDSGRVPGAAGNPDALYQVMPLVEGESLRDRLRRDGPLAIDTALRIASEVADALAYAHRHGIVHRDIKPENILIESEHAVVADFGIARAIDAAGGERLTGTGLAVGTPAYMSPEQITGAHDIDGRSDLYSLGCVLFEMLTGEPPFTGPSAVHVVQQQMVAAPRAVTQLRPSVPAGLVDIVNRALAKLPEERWQNADQLRQRVDAFRTPSGEIRAPSAASTPFRWQRLWIPATVAVAALAAGVFWARSRTSDDAVDVRIGRRAQVTLAPGLEVYPALSPDGDLLAYTAGWDGRLFVRQVDGGGTPIPIAREAAGPQAWPHWSPDGKQLAFASTRGIEIVPALGGVPRLVAALPTGAAAAGVSLVGGPWSPDGRAVSFVRGDTLYAVPVNGGSPRVLATVPALHSCAWSPDGRWIACVSGNFEAMTLGPFLGNNAPSAIVAIPAGSGEPVRVVDDGFANTSPAWLPSGALLFVSNRDGGRDIAMVRLAADGKVRSVPRRITTGLDALSITVPASGRRIGYTAFAEASNIWSLQLTADTPLSLRAARPVTTGNQVIEFLDVSNDGRWLVFDSDRRGNGDVYRLALDGTAEPEQLTTDPVNEFYPMVSPDGREIAFHSFRDGRRQLYVMPASGGPARIVARTLDDDRAAAWMPDGRGLVALTNYGSPSLETRIFRREASGAWASPVRWRKPPCMVSWSPDARVGACAELTGRMLLVDTQGDSLGVLVDSGLIPNMSQFPQWSADGRTVYYLGADSASTNIYAVPASGGQGRLVLRFDDATRPWHRYGFRVFRDRLYFTVGERTSHIWVADLGVAGGGAER